MSTIFFKISLGLVFLIVLTQFTLDLSYQAVAIPITGQSLAVLVVAALLGPRLGGMTIAIYLILGGIGLPVFANGASGWETFSKGSGGFLYGFLIAGCLLGWLAERWGIANFLKNIGMMALGTVVILLIGVGHLTAKYGLGKALEYGFYPFLPGAIIKVIAGALILTVWYQFSNKLSSNK